MNAEKDKFTGDYLYKIFLTRLYVNRAQKPKKDQIFYNLHPKMHNDFLKKSNIVKNLIRQVVSTRQYFQRV
jgi:hypothetical protein